MERRPYSLDTNVVVRFVMRDQEVLYQKASVIMNGIAKGDLTVLCDPVILAEIIWVLTSFYRLPRTEVSEALLAIVKPGNVLIPNKPRYISALKMYGEGKAHFADACACAAAIQDCEGRLFSFDRTLSKIEGIHRSEHP